MPFSCASSRASAISVATAIASSTGTRSALQPLGEVFAFHELQRERENAVGFLEAVDGGDVRVIERREQLGLAPEAGHALRVLRKRRRKHLDRDVAPELRVPRAEHLAHPAGADGAGDLVRTQPRSGSRRHPPADPLAWLIMGRSAF